MRNYWYDRQGQPIDTAKANELLGDMEYKRVALHEENGYRVSTVWLGADHNFMAAGPPLLFETMIFGPDDWQGEYIERWPTEAAALAGHDRAVEHLRADILGGGS
ncbi:hypothetical protein [Streptomyces sp.]|uniref:hypothetical protein n=1 Tax=Streptomyces sp. TaxID=1931 RepID=UPI002F92D61D